MMRSFFFAPANRHDLLAKFPRFGADCAVIDLEDGTPPDQKEPARAKLAEAVRMLREAPLQGRLMVRVNEPSSVHYLRDLEAAFDTDIDGVVVPKFECRDQMFPPLHIIRRLEHENPNGRRRTVLGGIESIVGVMNVEKLVGIDPHMDAVFFGAEDFMSEMGGRRSAVGSEVLYARSRVVLAARSCQLIALDQAFTDIRNDEQFTRDAEFGRDLGYNGKICLLPRQVDIANRVFSPSEQELDYARRLISTYRAAMAAGKGTIDFEGKMIDGPLLKRAENTIAVAEAIARRKAAAQ